MIISFSILDDIASAVVNFMKAQASLVLGAITTQVQYFTKYVNEALAFGSRFVVEIEAMQGHFDAKEFRQELDTFFDDAVSLAEEIPRLLVDF